MISRCRVARARRARRPGGGVRPRHQVVRAVTPEASDPTVADDDSKVAESDGTDETRADVARDAALGQHVVRRSEPPDRRSADQDEVLVHEPACEHVVGDIVLSDHRAKRMPSQRRQHQRATASSEHGPSRHEQRQAAEDVAGRLSPRQHAPPDKGGERKTERDPGRRHEYPAVVTHGRPRQRERDEDEHDGAEEPQPSSPGRRPLLRHVLDSKPARLRAPATLPPPWTASPATRRRRPST